MARDPRLLFPAKSLLTRAIHGNDAPAIACRSPRHAPEPCASTLPLGSVGDENQINERGERLIWLDRAMVNRLRAMRGPGASYSDVILRLLADAGSETDACAR